MKINYKKLGNMDVYIVMENGEKTVYTKETISRIYVKRLIEKLNELNIEYRRDGMGVFFNKENFDKMLKVVGVNTPEELERFQRLLYGTDIEIVEFTEVDGLFIVEEFTEDKECHSTYVTNIANEIIKDYGWKCSTYKNVNFNDILERVDHNWYNFYIHHAPVSDEMYESLEIKKVRWV